MTEDEAMTKWCPHAVASHTNPRGLTNWDADGNEIPAPRFQHNCIGSACMAWRWEPIRGFIDREMAPYEGFCGLASRP